VHFYIILFIYLVRPAYLPGELYILLVLISFFICLMISRRPVISGSIGLIFTKFLPSGSSMGADHGLISVFQLFKGHYHGNKILWLNWQDSIPHHYSAHWHS